MSRLKAAWQYVLVEPFTWIVYAFFQPRKFNREFEPERFLQRLRMMLRLIVPMILVALPLAILLRLIYLELGVVHDPDLFSFFLNIAGGIGVGIGVGIAVGIAFGIAVGIAFGIALGIAVGIAVGIALGIGGGIAFGIALGIGGGIAFGIALGIAFGIGGGIAFGIAFGIGVGIGVGIAFGIGVGIAFGIGIIIGLYRLPFYVISGTSWLFMYIMCQRRPQNVFDYLHRSALYWDELVYLPLPFLRRGLLIALDEDEERIRDELAFISAERPLQIRAARAVIAEMMIRQLETCDSLERVVDSAEYLAEIAPPESKLVDPRWITPLARLRDVMQDAARFNAPVGRQARFQALDDMKAHLHRVYPNAMFRDQRLSRRLGAVVQTWLKLAEQAQQALLQTPQALGKIDNPYRPGILMKPGDTRFVGRRDLARQLEETLSNRESRPAFLLYGERRMGKTTTLVQLPVLLGSHHIALFFDLQETGVLSTIAALLGKVAGDIYKAMSARGFQVPLLSYEILNEAGKQNQASVYHEFTRWLDLVEVQLEREERVLLLTFDEFEELNKAQQKSQIDVDLLLGWFRHLIQHHPRLALLFSGVSTLEEMEATSEVNWTSYFVSVQMLHVGFLSQDHARQLIMEPIPNFPSEMIFAEGVAEKIIEQTHGHPFLVQAVCSALIENLNALKREQAYSEDVNTAIDETLRAWGGNYFSELWKRTDKPQRQCLEALCSAREATIPAIAQHTGLDERTARSTLRILTRRDLVRDTGDGCYSIAAPIFEKWVERSLQG